jgi:hypothetical protein
MGGGFRGHLLWVGAVVALLGSPACGDDDDTAGSFAMRFDWPGGVKPDVVARPLYVRALVQEWPDGQAAGARTLNTAGPTLLAGDATATLDFGDLTYGGNRVVTLEMRNGPATTDQLFYFGLSELFTLEPGKQVDVAVKLQLQSAPGTDAAGNVPDDTLRFVVEGATVSRTNQRAVTVEVKLDPAALSTVTLANNASLSRGVKSLAATDLTASPLGGGFWRVPGLWNLDDGLPENIVGTDGERTVYARLTNGFGIESPPLPGRIFIDSTPPALEVVPGARAFNATATVRVVVNSTEPLAGPPRVALTYDGAEAFVFEAPATSAGLSYTYGVAAQSLASFGTNAAFGVTVSATDTTGNTATASLTSALALDLEAPEVSGLTVTPETISRVSGFDQATVSFAIANPNPASPETYAVSVGGVAVPAGDCVASGTQPLNVACTFRAPATATDGAVNALVNVTDAAGNVTSASRAATYDFTGPVLLGIPTVLYLPAANNALATVEAATAGTSARVYFSLSEALLDGAAAALSTAPTLANNPALFSATNGSFVFDLPVAETDPEGAITLAARATDAFGNESSQTLPVALEIDHTPPPGPTTAAEGLIVSRRVPWGADETGGVPRFTVRGGAGAAAAPGFVQAVSALGVTLGQAGVAADGSFLPFEISGDQAALRIVSVDPAGNRSPPSVVPEVEWVATLGGKVPGSTFENPNEFVGTQIASDVLEPSAETVVVPDVDGLATISTIRAGVLAQLGNSNWVDRTSTTTPPLGRSEHALAYDSGRGRVVLFGGSDNGIKLSDTWEWDGTNWTKRSPATSPPARTGHALAYDSARGRVVLFGGSRNPPNGGILSDTWEWDGTNWTQKNPATSPPARQQHALAYDSARGRVVLFGGYGSGDGLLSDTWEWDGTDWTQKNPATSPPARYRHALAYDSARGRLVLFGGVGERSTFLSDASWEWDGTEWTQKNPVTKPPGREGHALAYDRGRGRVVLFGGRGVGGGNQFPDTWEWDGTEWTQKNPVTNPPGRYFHALVYDSGRGRVVLFGGKSTDGTVSSDTWEWDGTDWTEKNPATSPPERYEHALAYDSGRGRVVRFGGKSIDGTVFSDTWEWDGTDWTQKNPVTHPPGRYDHALAYDSGRGCVVLFGGYDYGINFSDTWEWDGTDWTEKNPATSPSARDGHALAYDTTRGRAVLFGGYGKGDTWEWDGTDWTEKNPVTNPPARVNHALAYDSARGRVVLFGGEQNGVGLYSDTWEWDGTDWTQKNPVTSPPARSGHALAYDTTRDRVVLFGGYITDDNGVVRVSDTWEWDGTNWILKNPATNPPEREAHAVAYDSARGRVVLFGGSNGTVFSDTWEWDAGDSLEAGQRATFPFQSAQASASRLLAVTARWLVGGVGYPSGLTTNGSELLVWDEGQWKSIANNSAAPDAPEELTWATTDPLQLSRMFFGDNKTLNFAVRPTAPNGTGKPDDPDNAYGKIATDYVEVTVKYRLPAEVTTP